MDRGLIALATQETHYKEVRIQGQGQITLLALIQDLSSRWQWRALRKVIPCQVLEELKTMRILQRERTKFQLTLLAQPTTPCRYQPWEVTWIRRITTLILRILWDRGLQSSKGSQFEIKSMRLKINGCRSTLRQLTRLQTLTQRSSLLFWTPSNLDSWMWFRESIFSQRLRALNWRRKYLLCWTKTKD